MYPDHAAPSNPGLSNYPIFYSSFSNNLAILLAIFDTADQTDQSDQGLHDKLFCHFKQTRKKIRL